MYIAELKGKIPSNIKNSEDILTSNVFSFLNYSNRKIFLRSFMNNLELVFSDKELNEGKFLFWPKFEDGTEPEFQALRQLILLRKK